jgi:hypothetical protein
LRVDQDNVVASSAFAVTIDGTERARVDSSGRLLVGTSSTSATAAAVFEGASGDPSNLYLQRPTATPTDGNSLGQIFFADNAAGAAARIMGQRDGGTWTSGSSHPGRLVFSTTADGASTPTERMRIDSSGNATFAGNITVPSLNDGPLAGFRNQLINSSFLFDQYRNLEIDANGNTLGEGDFACDRWIVSGDPGGNWQNVTRTNRNITGVSTSGIGLRFNDVNNTTTAKRLLQAIELTNQGKNSQFVVGSTWTLSFWCDSDLSSTAVNSPVFRKVSTTSTDQVAISSTPPSNYTVGRTVDGFTHYSATFTVDNSVTSSADAANITCLSVLINLPPQTNSVIVAPQFEPGPVATPFEYRPFTTLLSSNQIRRQNRSLYPSSK